MSREASWHADLLALRQAAQRDDWHACRDAAARLLSRLPLHRALEITREQVEHRLPAFEHHQPGVTWPRQLIKSLAGMQTAESHWPWPDEGSGLPGPGADEFINAVKSLWQASLTTADEAQQLNAMADALASCILSDKFERWGSRHPEEWARRHSPPHIAEWDLNAREAYWRSIVRSPEARRLGLAAWLEVARRCQEAWAQEEPSVPHGQDPDLLALQQAAERREWDSCRFVTRRLLARLPLQQAVALTWEQVARRLPAFERHQPGVTWPRQFIESLSAGGGGEGWTWPEDDGPFPGPGANTFIEAVYDLWQAARVLTGREERLEGMVDAISRVIRVDVAEDWGARHPEQWSLWYRSALSEEPSAEAQDILLEMSTTPEALHLERQGWRDVAASCAQALGLGS